MADESVSEFVAVTDSDPETARFYLESCGGDITAAIESYFAHDEGGHPTAAASSHQTPPTQQPRQPPPRSRIAGFGDMPDEEEEADDGPEDNEYYAGGEKSGVAVKGGKKEDHVENLFESAKRHGAVQGTEADLNPQQEGTSAFTGRAQTLAGDVASHAPPTAPPEPVTIAFYTNGVFTVDDGEPRSMDDPHNADFLECVRNGECPPELENRTGGRPTKVNLVRKGTEYKAPPRPKYTAFSGAGQTLSSGDGLRSHPDKAQPAGGEWEGADESQPVTSIQIRLQDGSRVVARFNYSHTVQDIRRFIAASRPDLPNGGAMMAGFPAKLLDDDSLTVEQAGLVNSVVIQK